MLLRFTPNDATDIQLTRDKLLCMDSGSLLNDEVINLYMLLLQVRGILVRDTGRRANIYHRQGRDCTVRTRGHGPQHLAARQQSSLTCTPTLSRDQTPQERDGRLRQREEATFCHFFSSFFYNKLYKVGSSSV